MGAIGMWRWSFSAPANSRPGARTASWHASASALGAGLTVPGFAPHAQAPWRCNGAFRDWLPSSRAIPHLTRIEAQLMPFSGPVDTPLLDQGFHLYTRQFMLLDLQSFHEAKSAASGGMRLTRWNDRYFEPCAKLIYLAYANHVDGEINDQYCSRSGALRKPARVRWMKTCT